MSLQHPTPKTLQATHNKKGINFTNSLLENFPPKKRYDDYLAEISVGYVKEYIFNKKFLGFDGATVDHKWGGFEEAKIWILLSFQYLEEDKIAEVFSQLNKFKIILEEDINESDCLYDVLNMHEQLYQITNVIDFLTQYYA